MMPHQKNTQFDLAGFMKARKEARTKIVQENRKLEAEYKKVERVQEKVGLYNVVYLKYCIVMLFIDPLGNCLCLIRKKSYVTSFVSMCVCLCVGRC